MYLSLSRFIQAWLYIRLFDSSRPVLQSTYRTKNKYWKNP